MVKHYREGKSEESLGFEGVRVKSISERHHQKPESLVNCNQSKMSVISAVGGGGGRARSKSKALFKRVHSVKSPGKKKVTTFAKYSDIGDNYSSTTSESSYSSHSDEEHPPKKRLKKSHQRQPNGFTKNVNKKKANSTLKRDKHLKEEEEEYVVENIVDMKKDEDGTRYFFVKWENYDSTENTWEPIENLEKCHDIIEEFLKMRRNNNNTVQKRKPVSQPITTDEDDDQDESTDDDDEEDEEEDESDHKYDKDDKDNKLSVKEPKRPINGIVTQNSITFPDVSSIKASMISSVQKVVDVDLPSCATTPTTATLTSPSCSELSDEYYSDDGKSLQKINNLGTYIKIPHTGNLYYIRIIDEENGQINWIPVDVNEPQLEKEIVYRCVVTEDLTGKAPKFIFGATTSVDGEKFCLVQFEGHSFVEVIPPEILFLRFPSLRKFFEVHCPNLFQNNTH